MIDHSLGEISNNVTTPETTLKMLEQLLKTNV